MAGVRVVTRELSTTRAFNTLGSPAVIFHLWHILSLKLSNLSTLKDAIESVSFRSNDHGHQSTLHFWWVVDPDGRPKLVHNSVQYFSPVLWVNNLTAPEHYRCFDHVALSEKSMDVLHFKIVVVLINLWTKLYFLQLRIVGALFLFFGYTIRIFTVVHKAADWRLGIRRDLY